MTARASLGEYGLAAGNYSLVGGPVLFSAGRVGQLVRLPCLQKKLGHVGRACFSGAPVDGLLLRGRNLDRRDFLAAEERIEVPHPFFAVEADIEINTVERGEHADRIRSVLQDPRRPGGV